MDKAPLLVICLIFLLLIPASPALYAQSIGVGTTSPDASAALDITGAAQGLLIPRMNTAAVNSIPNPAKGLMVLDTIQNQLLVNKGTPHMPLWTNIVSNTGWRISGNAGTDTAYNFIGTRDFEPLVFNVGGNIAGYVSPYDLNTGLGAEALNVYISSRSPNTAIGASALSYVTTASYCSAIGFGSLRFNHQGSNNTAVGSLALQNLFSGSSNIALGYYAASDMAYTGENMAIGIKSLYESQVGNDNVVIGDSSMVNAGTGEGNTVIGYNAGNGEDMGNENTILGANCSTLTHDNNDVAIGQQVACTGSNQVRIGNSATYSIGGFADWTRISDGRYKMNIKEDVQGLAFVMKLRPVTYNLDVTALSLRLNEYRGKEPMPFMKTAMARKEAVVETGFVSQEVEQAAITTGYAFNGVDRPEMNTGLYGLRYAVFVVPLIKAVHEQQELIAKLKQRINSVAKQILFLQINSKKANQQL